MAELSLLADSVMACGHMEEGTLIYVYMCIRLCAFMHVYRIKILNYVLEAKIYINVQTASK